LNKAKLKESRLCLKFSRLNEGEEAEREKGGFTFGAGAGGGDAGDGSKS
jgi:hypothetical protein